MKNTSKLIAAGVLSCSMLGMIANADIVVIQSKATVTAEVNTVTVNLALTGLK